MEVKIGVQYSARELVLESGQSAEEIDALVTDAIKNDSVLKLTDTKGRTVMVAAAKISYVELGSPNERRMGFAN